MDGGRERFAARSKTDEKNWRASSGLPSSKAVDERQAETLGRPVAAEGRPSPFFRRRTTQRGWQRCALLRVSYWAGHSRRSWTG